MLRHRDVRSPQGVGVEELRVVAEAVARGAAGGRGRVLLVEAGEDTEELGRVGHCPRHRAGGVLIGGGGGPSVAGGRAQGRGGSRQGCFCREGGGWIWKARG